MPVLYGSEGWNQGLMHSGQAVYNWDKSQAFLFLVCDLTLCLSNSTYAVPARLDCIREARLTLMAFWFLSIRWSLLWGHVTQFSAGRVKAMMAERWDAPQAHWTGGRSDWQPSWACLGLVCILYLVPHRTEQEQSIPVSVTEHSQTLNGVFACLSSVRLILWWTPLLTTF